MRGIITLGNLPGRQHHIRYDVNLGMCVHACHSGTSLTFSAWARFTMIFAFCRLPGRPIRLPLSECSLQSPIT
jgi:hypothetical protein